MGESPVLRGNRLLFLSRRFRMLPQLQLLLGRPNCVTGDVHTTVLLTAVGEDRTGQGKLSTGEHCVTCDVLRMRIPESARPRRRRTKARVRRRLAPPA